LALYRFCRWFVSFSLPRLIMYANSRPVASAQTGTHEKLAEIVSKHANTEFRKPIAPYNRAAFDVAVVAWQDAGRPPLILDSGCGVGLSTMRLATQFPDHFVLGVDQSAHRLARNTFWQGEPPSNHLCVRAELADFWRLMHDAGIRLARHYLLYPNPWPKIGQLQRRWHGHPAFPTLPALGGRFECRSNWRIYIEECALALGVLGVAAVSVEQHLAATPLTPFEQKYRDSGHGLWRCTSTFA
jgi:tRNA G46 methylase TrmB